MNSYSIAILLYYTFFKRFVPVLVQVLFLPEAFEAASVAAFGVAFEVDEMDMPVAAVAAAAEPYSSYSPGI